MAKKKVFAISRALSQGLEETIESAQNYSSELRVDVVPIKRIELDPENPRDLMLTLQDMVHGILADDPEKNRKMLELESLQSMAHSIKTQGIINPITIYKHGEKYRLIAGERRTLASLAAGKTDIQAKILDAKPDDLKISLLQWIENIERADLSLWERITNLEKMVAAYAKAKRLVSEQISISELSDLLGCVKSHALNYKIILNADAEIKHLIAESKIKNLEKAAFIAGIPFGEIRQQTIHACLQGATLKQLKTIAERRPAISKTNKLIERRGRQTTMVNFGATKNVQAAKVVVESLLSNPSLAQIAISVNDLDWTDHRAIADTFKRLLKMLERIHT